MEYKVDKEEEIEPEVGIFIVQGIKDEVEIKSEKLFLEKEIKEYEMDFAEDYFWPGKKVDSDGKDLRSFCEEEFQTSTGCGSSVIDENDCHVYGKVYQNNLKQYAINEGENFQASCSEKSDTSNMRRPIRGVLKTFQCHPCACFFDTKVQWENHVSSIHGKEKPFKCAECDSYFIRNALLTRHIKSVHRKLKSLWCAECDYTSSVKENVIMHFNSVHKKETFCFDAKDQLENYIRAVHGKLLLFNCAECEYSSSVKENVKLHISSVHKKEKSFCFDKKDQIMEDHISPIHEKENPFNCAECNSYFSRIEELKHHIRAAHEKLLLFKCAECEFSSSVKENVLLHISSVHRKEKSFCFDTNDQLENHVSPINGKKIQFKGAECDNYFADIYARQCNKDEMTLVKLVVELKSKTRKEILQYCMELGLMTKSYKCFKCGGEMWLSSKKSVADNYIWRCKVTGGDNAHDITRSVRRGTWFAFSKLNISDILILTYMWVYKYPYMLIVREIDITQHTVTEWLNFAREVCQQIIFSMNTKIGGEGRTVELEESKFVKRKHNRGKGVEGQWVFGGVCRETKDCFLTLVDNRSVETLAEVIKNKILPHTTIYCDCWNVCSALENEGFQNLIVNNSIEFKNKEAGSHSDTIECLWKLAKEQLPSRNRSKSLVNSYLAEFIYRKMLLNKENDKFNAFLRDLAIIYPPICNDDKI